MKSWISWLLFTAIFWAAAQGIWSYYSAKNSNPLKSGANISDQLFEKMRAQGLPKFELNRLDGRLFKIEEVKDKLVIINFWASWCGPCREEFPSLLELIRKSKGKIVLLAISADENEQEIKTFLDNFGVQNDSIIVLRDPTNVTAKSFGTFKIPESYILKPGLVLTEKVTGKVNWLDPRFQVMLEGLHDQ